MKGCNKQIRLIQEIALCSFFATQRSSQMIKSLFQKIKRDFYFFLQYLVDISVYFILQSEVIIKI